MTPSETSPEPTAAALHAERLYRGLPIEPAWIGAGITAFLLCAFAACSWALGSLSTVRDTAESLWGYREVRLAFLVAALAGYLPTARHYVLRAAERNFAALEPLIDADPRTLAADRRRFATLDRRAAMRAGALGLLLAPLTGLIVDRAPSMYLQPGYWSVETAFAWGVGLVSSFFFGSFLYATLACARRFSGLARRLRPIDLLDLEPVAPFARQGLLSALLWLILLSLIALNVVDLAWFLATAAVALVGGAGALLIPLRGVHELVRRSKRAELARVNAAIRGDTDTLRSPVLGEGREGLALADLLAYRDFVESVREWPLDAFTIVRFVLYLAIPLGSWLGGALVERLLGAALD